MIYAQDVSSKQEDPYSLNLWGADTLKLSKTSLHVFSINQNLVDLKVTVNRKRFSKPLNAIRRNPKLECCKDFPYLTLEIQFKR